MTGEELLDLGPLAVVVVLLVRELVAAWKWREERRAASAADRQADEARELMLRVREDLVAARAKLDAIVERGEARSDDVAALWRRLYQDLAQQVAERGDERLERLVVLTRRCCETLDAATVVIEAALDRMSDDA